MQQLKRICQLPVAPQADENTVVAPKESLGFFEAGTSEQRPIQNNISPEDKQQGYFHSFKDTYGKLNGTYDNLDPKKQQRYPTYDNVDPKKQQRYPTYDNVDPKKRQRYPTYDNVDPKKSIRVTVINGLKKTEMANGSSIEELSDET